MAGDYGQSPIKLAKTGIPSGNFSALESRPTGVTIKTLALGGLIAVAACGQSAVIWNEAINGDLSDDRLLPNSLGVGVGSNELIGTTGPGDRDYFHFSLSAGQSLTGIIVRGYVSEDPASFLAVQEGTIITEDPLNANVANLLGWCLWGTPEIGMDILPIMGSNWGSIGFVPPLTGTEYTFWLQQTGDPTSYVLDFQVVPEPTSMVALTGLLGLMIKRRRLKTKA